MKVVVIGGSGFLGRNMIERLLNYDTKIGGEIISLVTCIDLRSWPEKDIAALPYDKQERLLFLQGDIMDSEVKIFI